MLMNVDAFLKSANENLYSQNIAPAVNDITTNNNQMGNTIKCFTWK